MCIVRKWKAKSTLGRDRGWEFEIGDEPVRHKYVVHQLPTDINDIVCRMRRTLHKRLRYLLQLPM
jgi:hypothetical protein